MNKLNFELGFTDGPTMVKEIESPDRSLPKWNFNGNFIDFNSNEDDTEFRDCRDVNFKIEIGKVYLVSFGGKSHYITSNRDQTLEKIKNYQTLLRKVRASRKNKETRFVTINLIRSRKRGSLSVN